MLVISVLVVAIVAAGYALGSDTIGITAGMKKMADGADTVFAKEFEP
jgi:hypothetical protein